MGAVPFLGRRRRRRQKEGKGINVDVHASLEFKHQVTQDPDLICLDADATYWNQSSSSSHWTPPPTLKEEAWWEILLRRETPDIWKTTPEFALVTASGAFVGLYLLVLVRKWKRRNCQVPEERGRDSSLGQQQERQLQRQLGETSVVQEEDMQQAKGNLKAALHPTSNPSKSEDIQQKQQAEAPPKNDAVKPRQQFPNDILSTPLTDAASKTASKPPSSSSRLVHPSQLPREPPASTTDASVAATAVPSAEPKKEGDNTSVNTTEALTQQLRQCQADWKQFKQDTKTTEAERLAHIEELKNQVLLQAQEETPTGVLELKQKLRTAQDDLLAFRATAQAQNIDYASQVQSLQTKLSHSNRHGSQHEASMPETSRPPPATDSTSPTGTSSQSQTQTEALHSWAGGIASSIRSAFRPVVTTGQGGEGETSGQGQVDDETNTKDQEPAQAQAQAAPNKAKAEYTDMIKEVQLLTQSLQKQKQNPTQKVLDDDKQEASNNPASDTSYVPNQRFIEILQKHLKERSGDCARLEAQITRLEMTAQHAKANWEAEKSSLESQVSSLQTTREAQKDSLQRHQTLNATLQADNEKLTLELQELKKTHSVQGQSTSDWESQTKELNEGHQKTVATLKSALLVQRERCEEVTKEKETLVGALEQSRQKVALLESDRQAEEQQWKGQIQSLEAKLQQQETEHRQDVATREQEAADLTARIGVLEKQVATTQEEATQVKEAASGEKQAMQNQIVVLERKLQETKTNHKQQMELQEQESEEVAEVSEQVSQALKNCEDCRKKMEAEFGVKEGELKAQISSLQNQLQKQTTETDEARHENETLQEQLSASRDEVATLMTAIQSREKVHNSELQALNQRLQQKSTTLQATIEAKDSICDALTAKVEELTASLEECQEEFDQFHDEAMSKEVVLSTQVQTLETKLQIRTKAEREDLARAERLSSQLEKLQLENREQAERFSRMSQDRRDVEDALKLRIDTLSGKLEAKMERIVLLEGDEKSLLQALESRDKEIARLRQDSKDDADSGVRTQDLASQVVCLEQELRAKERLYAEQLAAKDRKLGSTSSDLETLRADKECLESELRGLRLGLNERLTSTDDNSSSEQDRNFDQVLLKKVNVMNEELLTIREENQQLRTKLEDQVEAYRVVKVEMEGQIAEARATIERQLVELGEKEREFESYRAEAGANERNSSERMQFLQHELEQGPALAREKLSASENRCSELTTMTDMLTMELMTYGEKVKSLQDLLVKKDEECAATLSRLASAELQIESSVMLQKDLQQGLHARDENAKVKASLEAELREYRTEASALQLQVKALAAKNDADAQERDAAIRELATLKANTSTSTTQLDDSKQALVKMEEELAQIRKEKQDLIVEKEQLETSLRGAQASLGSIQVRLSRAEEEKESVISEQKAALDEMNTTKARLAKIERDLRDAEVKLEASERRAAEANVAFEEKQKAYLELQDRIKELAEKISLYKDRTASAETKAAEYSDALRDTKSKLTQLQEANETYKKQIAAESDKASEATMSLKADLNRAKKQHVEVDEALSAERRSLEELQSKHKALEDLLRAKEGLIQSSRSENSSLKKEVASLRISERKLRDVASRVPSLEAAVEGKTALEATLKRIRVQKQESVDAHAKTEEMLRASESKAQGLDAALSRKEKIVQRLFDEKKALEQKLVASKSLGQKHREANERIALLEKTLEKTKVDYQASLSLNEDTKAALSDTEKALSVSESKTRKLSEQLAQKASIMSSALGEKEAVARYEEQLQEANVRIRALEAGMEKLPILEADLLSAKRQKEESDKSTSSTEKQLRERIRDLEAKARGLDDALKRKEVVLQRLFSEKKELTQDLSAKKSLQEELLEAKRQISHLEASRERQEQESKSLSSRHVDLKEKADTDSKAYKSLVAELKEANRRVGLLEKTSNDKEVALATTIQEKKDLEAKHAELEQALQQKRLELDDKAASFASKLELASKEKSDALQLTQTLEASLRTSEQSLKTAQARLAELEKYSKLHDEEKQAMAQEIDDLKNAVVVVKRELQDAKKAADANASREGLVSADLVEKDKMVSELEAKSAVLAEQLNVSEKHASSANASCSELEVELLGLKEASATASVLQAKLEVVTDDLESLKEEHRRVVDAKDKLETFLLETGSDTEKLQLKVAQLEESVTMQENHSADLERLVEESKASANEFQSQLRDAENMRQALEARCERIQQEKQEVELTVESQAKEKEHIQLETASLRQRISDLEDANQSHLDTLEEQKTALLKMSEMEKLAKERDEELTKKANELLSVETQLGVSQRENLKSSETVSSLEASIAELRSTKQSLSEKVVEFEAAKKLEVDEKMRLVQECASLKEEAAKVSSLLQESKQQVESLEKFKLQQDERLDSLQRQRDSSLDEKKALETALESTRAEKSSALDENKALAGENAQLVSSANELREQLQEARRQVDSLEQHKSHQKDRVESLQRQSDAHLGEKERLEKQLASVNAQFEAFAKKNYSELEALKGALLGEKEVTATENAELQAKCADLTRELEESTARIVALEGVSGTKQESLEAARDECQMLKAEMEAVLGEKEALAQVNANLKASVSTIEGDLQEAKAKLKSAQSKEEELVSVQREKDDNLSQTKRLENELAEAKEACESLSQQVRELKETAAKVESLSQEVTDLEEKYKLAVQENESLTGEIERVKADASSREEELQHASDLLKTFRKRESLAELNIGDKDKRCVKLEGEVAELQAGLEDSKKLLVDAETKLTEKCKALADVEDRLAATQNELASHKEEAKQQLDAELKKANATVESLKEQLVDLEAANQTYLDSLANQMEVSKELSKLQETQGETSKKLSAASDQVVALEAKLKEALLENETVKELTVKLEETVKSLNQEKAQANSARDAIAGELSSARSKVETLEHRVMDLEDASKLYLDTLASQMSLSQENGELKESKESLENQLKEATDSIDMLKKEAEKQSAAAEAQTEQAKSLETELAEKKKAHQETLDEIEKHCVDLSNKVNVVSEKLHQKESQLEKLQESMKSKETERVAKIESLTSKLRETDATSANLEAQIESEKSEVTKQLEESQAQCKALDATVQSLQSELDKSKDVMSTLREELSQKEAKLKDMDDMTSKLNSVTEELKEQQGLQEKVNESMTKLMQLVEEKSAECDTLGSEVVSLKKSLEEKASLQTDIEALRSKMEGLQKEQERTVASMLEAQEQKAESEARCSRLSDELTSLRDQIAVMESESHGDKDASSNEVTRLRNELRESDKKCSDLTSKLNDLTGDCAKYAQTIARLEDEIQGKKDSESPGMKELQGTNNSPQEESAAIEMANLRKELAEQHLQQEKMNQSMVEMLGLWDEKESQCATFKEKLDELTEKLANRDAHIAKLKADASDQRQKMSDELQLQQGLQEKTNEKMEAVLNALAEKEKEVSRLSEQVKELSADHQETEQERGIQMTRSEDDRESLKTQRKEEMFKSTDDKNAALEEERKLSDRLESLTNKISAGERQLKELESEFKKKWEQSSADAQSNTASKKEKKGKKNILSRFRR